MLKEYKSMSGNKILIDIDSVTAIERQITDFGNRLVLFVEGHTVFVEDDNGALYEEVKNYMLRFDDIDE
ncbi:hypothetical protein [Methanobrevibacter sp.]|uniref:hypothetical protein n=1 Tax=Methanobrevibacter sp. TaxID=66852 RepID=UPI00388FFBA3